MWLGPPSSQSRMTEVSLRSAVNPADAARARSTSASPRLAMPATPSCKKLRRLMPSQYFAVLPASTRNIDDALHSLGWEESSDAVSNRWEQARGGKPG